MNKLANAIKKLNDCLKPPPDIAISEWADRHRILSREASSEAGKWRTSRTPYFLEPMNACKDPEVQTIVVKSASQLGKTELILNIIGYYSQNDPSPMLLIQPTVEMAEAFSKDRLAPMIRDTPILRTTFSSSKSRASNNTITHKNFTGGQITLIGANSPSNLAMRPVRLLLCDEICRYPFSAGTEGNPIDLAEARTTTFYNRLKILVSTPTEKHTCQITQHYEQSSQGKYCLLCPSCDQPNYITRKHLVIQDVPLLVKAACESCGSIHIEKEWKSRPGVYIHADPENKIRGFWLNGYASTFITWEEIEQKYIKSRSTVESRKVFHNTVLAEVWEEEGERADPQSLLDRREPYEHVPEDCIVLTCAVDTQDNRLEYEVCGWGVGLESWSIEYGVILGDPSKAEVWKQLESLIFKKTWPHQSGRDVKITATTIDLGGHNTQSVYDFCEKFKMYRVWPIRGVGGWGLPLIKQGRGKHKRTGKDIQIWNIAVDSAKIWVERRLKTQEKGEGFCHFNFKFNDELYFEGLTSEKLLNTRDKKGYPVRKWVLEPGKRNEPLDLRVYNYACIKMLNPVFEKLKNNFKGDSPNTELPRRRKKRTGVLSKGL